MSENLSCLHINFLELLAVFFALRRFCSFIQGHHVLVRTDNTTMVAYITRQGEVCSRQLHSLVRRLILWSRDRFLSLRVTHVLGALNAGADMLSSTPMYREWTLHAGVCGTYLGSLQPSVSRSVCVTEECGIHALLLPAQRAWE